MTVRDQAARRRFRSASLIFLPPALALGFAGCGGGGGDDTPAPQPQPTPLPSPPSVPPLATGAPIVLSFGGTVGTTKHWDDGDTSTGGQGADVDGLPCVLNMDESYHVHAHLSIFLNGDQLQVPKEIGLPKDSSGNQKCNYSLHTHDYTGELHVEAPSNTTFTLGQFFDIWGQPLDATNVNVGGIVGLPIKVYVVEDAATAATEYTGDLKKLELTRHRQITIQIGTAITSIPVYDFGGA
jgi:hypothetical protein